MSNKSLWIKDTELVSKIPENVQEDLRKLNEFLPSTIAGGYLRDLYMNRTWKDIDVFIEIPSTTKFSISNFTEEVLFELLKLSDDDVVATQPGEYFEDAKIFWLVDVLKGGIPYQLILGKFKLPTLILKNFNFHINQIAFNGKSVVYTQEFLKNAQTKDITFVKNYDDLLNPGVELWKASDFLDRHKEFSSFQLTEYLKKYQEATRGTLKKFTFNTTNAYKVR